MIGFEDFAGPVRGALALAGFDRTGLRHFDMTRAGFRQSWWTVALSLPFILLSTLCYNRLLVRAGHAPDAVLLAVAVDLAQWLGFCGLLWLVLGQLQRGAMVHAAIMVMNWGRLLGAILVSPLYLLAAFGIIDVESMKLLWLLLLVYVILYYIFSLKTVLDVPWLQAVGLVCLDLMLGAALSHIG